MTITSPKGERFELNRGSPAWTVNGLPADSTAMDRLLRAVRDATIGDMASSSQANQQRMGVSSDSAWTLEFRPHTGQAAKLLLGKEGASYSTVYARLPDQDATWVLSGDLRAAATRTLADWRDKTIVRIDTAKVAKVRVDTDSAHYALVRSGAAWQLLRDKAGRAADSVAADSTGARNLLGQLARIEASGFAPDTATFTGTHRTLLVLGTAGDTLAAIDFAGAGVNWMARRTGATTTWQVPSYQLDQLMPKPDQLAAKPKS